MTELETFARPASTEEPDAVFLPPTNIDAYGALSKLSDEAQCTLYNLFDRLKKSEAADALGRTWEAVKQGLSREKTDWTLAFNLTTDYGSGYGVEQRMTELQELAEKTKGKPVTFVVQAAMPDYQSAEAFLTGVADSHYLDRYVIRDGQMTWIESAKSKGYAKDTEDLLAFTGKRFDAKQMGLVIDSHGSGNRGLTGDTGSATVPEFVDAVKNGLKAARRAHLDVLDFDCCLMSQNGVVSAVKDLSRNVVASAETEHIAGQELITPLEKILDNPRLTAAEVSREFVDASKKRQATNEAVNQLLHYFGVDKSVRVPIKTLSHISTSEYDGFRTSLDAFGDKLTDRLKDDKSRAGIEQAIDDTATYGSRPPSFFLFFFSAGGSQKYDLKDFTQKIVKAIDSGAIQDEDGSLKACAEEVLARRGKLVRDYFGHGKYEGLGGLSTFLPERDLRTGSKEKAESVYKAELVTAENGWGKFRHALRHAK